MWWLLALCGAVDAISAATNLLMLDPNGSASLRKYALPGAVWDISMLAVVAAACAIAVGVWNCGRTKSWLLLLHGVALGAFGVIGLSPLVRGPLSFRPISLLFVVMAASLGAFALGNAQTVPSRAPGRWFFFVSGAASLGFAVSFIAVGFGWVKLEPQSFWIWMSSYFGLCAIFMLYLALLVRGQGPSRLGSMKRYR
jgi:hypothetical protein